MTSYETIAESLGQAPELPRWRKLLADNTDFECGEPVVALWVVDSHRCVEVILLTANSNIHIIKIISLLTPTVQLGDNFFVESILKDVALQPDQIRIARATTFSALCSAATIAATRKSADIIEFLKALVAA